MKNVFSFLNDLKILVPIIQRIKQAGGVAYLVGGSVRDLVLDLPVKDIDIEVHTLALEQLEKVLEQFGKTELVGKQFGVLRISQLNVDWSLPRTDSVGRKPEVVINPNMDIKQALRRRDVTMNAMAINLNELADHFDALQKKAESGARYDVLFTIIDPYHGLEDMANKRLRAVDKDLFLEDPLRFFRVMQFLGRFEMQPDAELQEICRVMPLAGTALKSDPSRQNSASSSSGQAGSVDGLARERIFEEIKKLLLKARRPSLGFRWLASLGRLEEFFPELYALIGVAQRPDFHPEGDVFEHTMQALDAAATLHDYQATENMSAEDEKLMIMLATLCHDLGKAVTTDENLSCHGHDDAGEPLAYELLKRITDNVFLLKAVCKLVRNHMRPFTLARDKSSPRAYKRLALALAPELSMRQIALLALADTRGRNAASHEPLTEFIQEYDDFLEASARARVTHAPEKPVLLGRHLLGLVPPGPAMGALLDAAYQIQIDEGVTDVEELKRRVLK